MHVSSVPSNLAFLHRVPTILQYTLGLSIYWDNRTERPPIVHMTWINNWHHLWKMHTAIDPIHKWRLFYFCSVIVQISLPSLTLEQELFSIKHITTMLGSLICTRTKEKWIGSHLWTVSMTCCIYMGSFHKIWWPLHQTHFFPQSISWYIYNLKLALRREGTEQPLTHLLAAILFM